MLFIFWAFCLTGAFFLGFEELNKYFKGRVDIKAAIKILFQQTGQQKTYCAKCGKIISFKLLDFSDKNPFGYNYTRKCGCGVEINYYKKPDEFHSEEFWVKVFKTKYENKDFLWKKKVLNNGKQIIARN